MFDTHSRRWNLTVDGEPITTPRAHLLPVRFEGHAAMLKLATYASEVLGNAVMSWWAGASPATLAGHSPDTWDEGAAPGGQAAAGAAPLSPLLPVA